MSEAEENPQSVEAVAASFLAKEDYSQEALSALIATVWESGVAAGRQDQRKSIIRRCADDINSIVNIAWRTHRDILQRMADDLGEPLHSAIPDVAIHPRTRGMIKAFTAPVEPKDKTP